MMSLGFRPSWLVIFLSMRLFLQLEPASSQETQDDEEDVAMNATGISGSDVKLFSSLFDKYDKRLRPSANSSSPVRVEIGLLIRRIEYLDEKRQTLLFHATSRLRWTDPRLTWNPRQFDTTEDIAYASFALWIPDILLSNDADPYGTRTFQHTLANIYFDGQVNVASPSSFKVLCGMDFGDWPYDEQSCTIEFESFTHEGTRLSLHLMADNETVAAQLLPFASNNEWSVRDLKAQRLIKFYECCSGEFHSVLFTLRLQRKEHFFKPLILTPLVAAIFSSWLLFLLPLDYALKFVLGGIEVVFVGLFAMFLKHTIPPTVDKTPPIVLMTVETLVMILVANAVQLVLHHISRRKSPMPNILRTLILDSMQRICCHQSTKTYSKPPNRTVLVNSELDLDHFELEDGGGAFERNQHEWTTLAKYLNRCCFIVYICASLIILI